MARVPAEHRRQEFVRATIGVIAEHGVPGTTTRQIAAAAGAPLASLHYCFSSKEELLAAVFEEQTRVTVDGVSVPPGIGLAAAAERIIRDTAAWCLRHRDFVLAQEELNFWARRQAPVDAARAAYDRYHAQVTAALEAACRRSDDPSLAAPTASMISNLMDGLLLQWFAFRDEQRFLDDIDRAVAICSASLRSRRSTKVTSTARRTPAATKRRLPVR